MKTSLDLAKMFHDQFNSKGKKNGSRISSKQGDWLRNVYLKENPSKSYTNKPIIIYINNTNTNHYRLNTDNSLYLVETAQ